MSRLYTCANCMLIRNDREILACESPEPGHEHELWCELCIDQYHTEYAAWVAGTLDEGEIRRSKPIQGVCKSHALWVREGVKTWPVLYFRKPKHLSQDVFEALLDGMEIAVTREAMAALEGG